MATKPDDATRRVAYQRALYYQALKDGRSKEEAFAIANSGKEPLRVASRKVIGEARADPAPKPPEAPAQASRPTKRVELNPTDEEVPPVQAKTTEVPKAAPQTEDDLTKIQRIGPSISRKLNGIGVTRYSQIAAWTDDDVRRIDEALSLRGRITREGWVEQAKSLARNQF